MPIVIPVRQLEPGMCLASNIVNRFSVLLPHGHTLSENDIAALVRRFPDKMVQIIDPLLDRVVEFEDDSQDQKISLEIRRNVSVVSQRVSGIIRSGTALKADNIAGMQRTVEEMMQYLQDNPVTMAVIEQSGGWDDYLQEHCANVFYLSLVIGNTIRNYIKQERERLSAAKSIHDAMNLTPLATAALVHDIGMVPLERLYHKKEPLSKEDIELIKAHPKSGSEMLPDKIEAMTRLVVRCHHENQNGSGYPEGLEGEKITIFARIVRVADAYSAAISKTIYKKAKSQAQALYEMLQGNYKRYYDPVVLRVFSGIIQPFPIGAKLKLENGRIAVVTRHNSKNPFKPEIIIAFDEQGNSLPEDKYEGPFFLDEHEDIKVASFEGDDISFVNEPIKEKASSDLLENLAKEYEEALDLAYP